MKLLTLLLSTFMIWTVSMPNQGNKLEIVGEWKIIENETVGTFSPDPEKHKNSSFFGAELWSRAVGKTFTFYENGTVSTDMAEVDISDKIKLEYSISENQEILNFKAINLMKPDLPPFEFFVELKFENETMLWVLDELKEFKLKKNEN